MNSTGSIDGKTPPARQCSSCGAPLRGVARYCPRCGRLTTQHRDRDTHLHLGEPTNADDSSRHTVTVAIGFTGVLLIVTAAAWVLAQDVSETATLLCQSIALAVLGWVCAHRAGIRDGWSIPPEKEFAIAIVAAAGTLTLSALYVSALRVFDQDDVEAASMETTLGVALLIATAVPLVEEWLCRGSLYTAISQLTTRRRTIVLTAILFAFLHMLNGAAMLEVPHRFATGLVLGWLRDRSSSLLPCILAHALHNGGAVLLEWIR